jgi:arylsulfatase A-like enzyme
MQRFRRPALVGLATWLIAAVLVSDTVAGSPRARPNIVVVMTDDQGYGDLGITGNGVLETPHTDRLAMASARLPYFYVSPVCAPTRASLLTGRYNYRTRAIDTWVGRAMMDPAEITLAEILRDAGYETGIFGKWHLGDCFPLRAMDQGFDDALVHLGGGLAQPSEPIENNSRYTDAILFRNGQPVNTSGYCTDVYFDAALQFIARSHEAGAPFFAYVPTNAPHSPFHDVPVDLYEKYKTKDLSPVLGERGKEADDVARIFAMCENIDQNVGRLLSTLDRLEIAENTIVVYLHDNGPRGTRYVGPMRGSKTGVHEGGIRSPFFVRWPARLNPGEKSAHVAAHIDVLPTLLEAAGVDIPPGLRIDGRSLLPLLEERAASWPDRLLVLQSHRGNEPSRYHHFAAIQDAASVSSRWKLLRASGFHEENAAPNHPFELYDLAVDPREQVDLAAAHPDVVARLKSAYSDWFDDVSDSRSDNYAPPRIVIGNDKETTTLLTHQDWRRLSGKGWGTSGEWLVTFEGDHNYELRIVARERFRHGDIEILGQRRSIGFSAPSPTLSHAIQLEVSVPPGDASLRVSLHHAGEEVVPHHVYVTRR